MEEQKKRDEVQGRRNLLVPQVERWDPEGGEPIVELKDVRKSFGEKQVLRGLNLAIEPGKITIIVGASGSGKSVLIKHMSGLLHPDEGEVRLFGQNIAKLSAQGLDELRKRIGAMFQNYALFDSLTVEENVAFPLVEHNAMDRAQATALAREILVDLELGHAVKQYPSTLSGGMKKRVSLARAIVANPELVFFDEPTTGLDPVMMEVVDQMIQDITTKYGLTSVLISHDLATIFRIADRVALLHEGQIIAYGEPEEIRGIQDKRVQELIGGRTKSEIQVNEAESAKEDREEEAPVVMEGLHKSFGTNHVLRGIDFVAHERKLTTLIGGSGSGKSVMMRHLLGLMQPDEGEVRVFGRSVQAMGERERLEMRTGIGMLFQHAALFDSMSVRDNVAFPLVERRLCSRREAHERTEALLERLHLAEIADAEPTAISSGQRKRVSLARALITEPRLLIYDEPTTGQDPIMSQYVEDMIMEVQANFDVTSIVISHDMASAFRTADYIAMLYKGEIIAFGTPQEIAASTDERVHSFVYAADVAAQERRRRELAQGIEMDDVADSAG